MKAFQCSSFPFILLSVILLAIINVVRGDRAVLGIDFGASNVRVAIVRGEVGNVEIVLNFETDRKTINSVSFREENILYGQTAMNMFSKFPKAIFCRLNMLLGKFFDSSDVQEYQKLFSHNLKEDPQRHTVQIEEPVGQKMIPIEQLTATFFVHLMDQAEAHAGFPVVDAVIAVPAYFNQFERQAVLDAAKIAGLNVLGLINGVSSAALLKATTGTKSMNGAANFIIYDSGAGGTSAALVRIDPKRTFDGLTASSAEILAIESEAGLGGNLIDDRIANYLIELFKTANPRASPITPGKAYNKVLVEAEKIKKVLNANDKSTANIEDLIDDLSFSQSITRLEIDGLLEDLQDRFVAPVKRLLEKSNIPLEKIDSILLLGGNSRHHFLLKTLRSAFGNDKLAFTLDPDEATVRGAALYGSKLHPVLKLRPVHFFDIAPLPLHVEYFEDRAEEIKKVDLFPAYSPVSSKKSLTLKRSSSHLKVQLFSSQTPHPQRLAQVFIHDADKALADFSSSHPRVLSSKLRVPVSLSIFGHALVESPVILAEYEEEVTKTIVIPPSTVTAATATTTAQNENAGDSSSTTSTSTNSDATDSTSTTAATATATTTITKSLVKRSQTINLKHEIVLEMSPMEPAARDACRASILAARQREQAKLALATARNNLENLVYNLQGIISGSDFIAFTANNERRDMAALLNRVSSALADPDETKSFKKGIEDYHKYEADLKKFKAAADFRQQEETSRPAAIDHLQQACSLASQYVQVQKPVAPRPQTDAELNDLAKKSDEGVKWLNDQIKKQGKLARHDNPVLLVKDINDRALAIKLAHDALLIKILPEPEKKPVEEKEKEKEENPAEEKQEDAASQEPLEGEKQAVAEEPLEEHFEL